MEEKQRQQCIKTFAQSIPDLQAVYLFGSFAAEGENRDSDMDLAVLSASPVSDIQCWEISQRLAVQAGRDVDVIDLQNASTVMRMQVVSQGERIHCCDEKEVDRFEDYVYASYARFNEERKGILEDIRRRGNVHGE